jgi:hypothetical protein
MQVGLAIGGSWLKNFLCPALCSRSLLHIKFMTGLFCLFFVISWAQPIISTSTSRDGTVSCPPVAKGWINLSLLYSCYITSSAQLFLGSSNSFLPFSPETALLSCDCCQLQVNAGFLVDSLHFGHFAYNLHRRSSLNSLLKLPNLSLDISANDRI